MILHTLLWDLLGADYFFFIRKTLMALTLIGNIQV